MTELMAKLFAKKSPHLAGSSSFSSSEDEQVKQNDYEDRNTHRPQRYSFKHLILRHFFDY
jgi:hypothetical protein